MRRALRLLTCIMAFIATLTAAVDPCKTKRNKSFTTRVLVELGMDHKEKVTTNELDNLRLAFMEAYNDLAVVNSNNPDHCDMKDMRAIEEIEVKQKDYFYLYENGKQYRRMFLFSVTGGCKDCPWNYYLFDKSNSRRLGAQEEEPSDELVQEADNDRELFTVEFGGKCQCMNSAERRAPTEDEFKVAFKAKVDDYKESRKLTFIKGVTSIVQLDKVSCVDEETDFETTIIAKLKDLPSPEDFAALELGFHDSYNELTRNRYRDPLHHRVTEVEIEDYSTSNRRLGNKKRRFRLKLKGRCRGCKKKARLFNDISPKRRLEEQEVIERALQTATGTCWWPRFPSASRTPKYSEFVPVYDRTVQITNNVGVDSVEEL